MEVTLRLDDPVSSADLQVKYHDLKAAVNPLIAADIGKVDYILHLAEAGCINLPFFV